MAVTAQPQVQDYQFFFVGGSCGSFVKIIFYVYLCSMNQNAPLSFIKINPVTGECPPAMTGIHGAHWIHKLDPTKKTILIDFDNNDKRIIARMAFHKVVVYQILQDPTCLKTQWNIDIDPGNVELLEKTFGQNPDYLIFPDWRQQVSQINPVLTIKFKDIFFGDISKTIADFLQTDRLPELDFFIEQFRKINQKYFEIT
jgi:hypothetical protein